VIIFIIPKNSGLKQRISNIIKQNNILGEIIEIRGEDIPLFIDKFCEEGKEVIGITGEDLFKEYILKTRDSNLKAIKKIAWIDNSAIYNKPVLCLLGPKGKNLESLGKDLKVCINKKYIKISKKYLSRLEDKGLRFKKIYFSGSTETAFERNICDLVIDIVYSGRSIKKAGLDIYDTIFFSNIVIIKKEKSLINELDFDKMEGLVPTILKDRQGNILTLVYSNKKSLSKTLKEDKPYFFSRSRKKVCLKGETSGNTQKLIEIKTDCDKDALIFIIEQKNNACHLNRYSCFNEEKKFNLEQLYNIICKRIRSDDKSSYTVELANNLNILKRKIIEEAGEVITAKDKKELIWECSDLLYFLLVIMAKNNVSLEDINKENKRRNEETLLNKENLTKPRKEKTK